MPASKNTRCCTHIKVNGIRCGSPAMYSEVFCYFHQRMIRGIALPPKSRLHPIALIEDEEAIQASLMEVINALVCNTIDARRAQLILRALSIAVRNSSRVHFRCFEDEMVREVPSYPAAPPPPQGPRSAPPPEVAIAEQAATEYLKATEEKALQAKASALSQSSQPAKVAAPKLAAAAAPAPVDPTRRKPPARVMVAMPARKSAHGHFRRDSGPA